MRNGIAIRAKGDWVIGRHKASMANLASFHMRVRVVGGTTRSITAPKGERQGKALDSSS